MTGQLGDWYDFPQYYECFFRGETAREVRFLEKMMQQAATIPVRKILELGCGGGRLTLSLARRGYRVFGLDRNTTALAWLQRRAARLRIRLHTVLADLTNFRLQEQVDMAVCTFNTFRHLLSEKAAISHFKCVADCVRPGGLYVVGLHLLPLDVAEDDEERWSARRGCLRLHARLRVERTDRQRRREWLHLVMTVRSPKRYQRFESRFVFRLYTRQQFLELLRKVPCWAIAGVYDFWYDWRHPRQIDDRLTDAVFVLRRS